MPFKQSICIFAAWNLAGSCAFAPTSTMSSLSLSLTSSALQYSEKNEDSSERKPSWWLPSQYQEDREEQQESEIRKERLIQMQEDMARFAQGKDLQTLRSDIQGLKQNLQWSLATDDLTRMVSLTKAIEEKEQRDPDLVYLNALKNMIAARKMSVRKKYEALDRYTKEASSAREYIPRLNMDGLWLGNFQEGSQLVNVTYSGDELVATQISGDAIDVGRVIFRADLSPPKDDSLKLSPVPLQGVAKGRWGAEKLERYRGKGFDRNARSQDDDGNIDGNLIMFDGYFSFLWIPTRKHVFFSRPNPNLVLHMMRDAISEEDEVQNMKDHLTRCFEKNIDEAFVGIDISANALSSPEPFRRIATEADLEAAKEDCKISIETLPLQDTSLTAKGQSFWDFHKWMKHIDDAMNQDGEKK